MIWGLSDAMSCNPDPWTEGYLMPGVEAASASQVPTADACVAGKQLIEKTVTSGLIYPNSDAGDFKVPELRAYLDRYLRGSNGK